MIAVKRVRAIQEQREAKEVERGGLKGQVWRQTKAAEKGVHATPTSVADRGIRVTPALLDTLFVGLLSLILALREFALPSVLLRHAVVKVGREVPRCSLKSAS
jgi:hypothetical protein